MSNPANLQCIECQSSYPLAEVRYACDCGGLLAVSHPQQAFAGLKQKADERLSSRTPVDRSGVWRFREAILPGSDDTILTQPEGQTRLYQRQRLSDYCGIADFHLKHEGENPTGSFKDRGMTVAVTQAKRIGAKIVACASTGNTSAALAAYASHAGIPAIVLIPSGKIALGKLAQAVAYNAHVVAIKGDFDAAMGLVKNAATELGVYMVNSLNPFRLEGQKSIIWELLQDLNWKAPDWIVVPAGNLGNTSAFGKAINEAYAAGWINKKPRIASIQASGANPFFRSFQTNFDQYAATQAETIATAIRIGAPVNFPKAKRAITDLDGVVSEVDDTEILAAKQEIDGIGIGCEPASACSLAGAKRLLREGIIKPSDTVVGILTGHILKDPDIILKSRDTAITELNPTSKDLAQFIDSTLS